MSTSRPQQDGLAYLVAEFPASNHNYLLGEIAGLRASGLNVRVVSVSPSAQPLAQQGVLAREEGKRTCYLKSTPLGTALASLLATAFRHPRRFCAAFWYALRVGGLRGSFYFAEAVLLGVWMQRNGLSHVHAHFAANVALIASKIFPGIAASFTAHGYGEFYAPSSIHLPKRIAAASFVRSISCIGRAHLMLAAPPPLWPRIVCSPLGIAPESFRRIVPRQDSPALRISCVGRLSPEKGNRILLEAAASLLRQGVALHLRFIGDGPDLEQLQQEVAALGIADHVSFDGWIGSDEMASIYEETDAVAMASLYEGVPIVLMEAMSMGIPCIAPRVGGIAELIEDGVSGIVVNPAQSQALAEGIRRLAQSPDLRKRLGESGRERVMQHYDIAANTVNFARTLRGFWRPAGAERLTSEPLTGGLPAMQIKQSIGAPRA